MPSLQRSKKKETCPCCGDYQPRWTYQYHALRYCVDCLYSIGVDTNGNPCTEAQYKRGWRNIVEGRSWARTH